MTHLRTRTFEILETGKKQDTLSRVIDLFLIVLIILNVILVILETLPSLELLYHTQFEVFESVSVLIFTVEYLARIWSSVEHKDSRYHNPVWGRLRYMLTPMALIDLIVIMPFYLVFFVSVDLRFMRVLRLLRVFKLTRYSSSMSLLLQVLHKELRSIGAALFVLLMLIIMASSLTYLAEHETQPEVFSSIPAAMWWAIVTLTTVGYGDVIPITAMGKIMASVISIISLGIVALPAGLLASGFSEALRERRLKYEQMVGHALEDGVVSFDEHGALDKLRDSLGISREEAEHILELNKARAMEKELEKDIELIRAEIDSVLDSQCPHCHKRVDWLDRRKRESDVQVMNREPEDQINSA